MSPRIATAVLVIASALLASAAGAQLPVFDSLTVAGPLTPRPLPCIELAPGDVPEIVYSLTAAGVTTAIRATIGATVAYETIADDLASTARPLWALAPSGAPRAAWFKANGRFVCATRGPGGWVEDSSLVDVVQGSYCRQDLAADPVSGEPRVAFTVPATGGTGWIHFARRDGGTWSVADVDTVPVCGSPVSLALDADGLPWIAYDSPAGDTLFVAHRDSPDGPFVHEVAAVSTPSESGPREYWSASLALDPVSGQPRIAWYLLEAYNGHNIVGYSSRGAGGSWSEQVVYEPSTWPYPVVLALDAAGAPTVAYTLETSILATGRSAATSAEPERPSGVTSTRVWVARRDGLGVFWSEGMPLFDVVVERGGMALAADRSVAMALRTFTSPFGVVYLRTCPGTSDVAPAAPSLALAPPAPNPARSGEPLRIAFTLPRAEQVSCDLLDVSGRCVATVGPVACTQGPGGLEWNPGTVPPGIYFLRLRLGDRPGASRRIVLLD